MKPVQLNTDYAQNSFSVGFRNNLSLQKLVENVSDVQLKVGCQVYANLQTSLKAVSKLNCSRQNLKVGVLSDAFSIKLMDFIQKSHIKTAKLWRTFKRDRKSVV